MTSNILARRIKILSRYRRMMKMMMRMRGLDMILRIYAGSMTSLMLNRIRVKTLISN